jgi:hypothetical protein
MKRRRKPELDPEVTDGGPELLRVRAGERAANRIQMLADLYAGGNLSLWVRYASLNAPLRYLVPPDAKQPRGKKKVPEKKGA